MQQNATKITALDFDGHSNFLFEINLVGEVGLEPTKA